MSAAELSHTSHTRGARRAPNSFRLGWGEVVQPADMALAVRCGFLMELRRIVPECYAELRGIYELWRDGAPVEARQEACCDWLQKWNLRYRGAMPQWLSEVVEATFLNWTVGIDDWGYPRALPPLLLMREELVVPGRRPFNPQFEHRDSARRRLPAKYYQAVDDLIDLALSRGGVIAPWRSEPLHIEMLTRRQVLRETGVDLGKRFNVSRSAVEVALARYQPLLGLSVPRGRPPRRPLSQ